MKTDAPAGRLLGSILITMLIAACAGSGALTSTTAVQPSAAVPTAVQPSAAAPTVSAAPTATNPALTPSPATDQPLSPPPSASSSPAVPKPTLTGSIAFMRDDGHGYPQTWVACADLTNQKQLTDIADSGSGWPVWSPDGSRIAVDTDRDATSSGVNDVFTMARDGSDVRKLTDSVGLSGDPGWSPDGKLIAFEADRGSQAMQGIYVANASDGSGLLRITTLPAGFSQDRAPRFSPDGKQIVFTREASDSSSTLDVVNLDGSGLRSITSADLHPGDATWSPDGTQISFEADLTYDGRTGPWVVGSDGVLPRSLTGPQDMSGNWTGFSDPVWSPDGTLIMMLEGIHTSDGTPISSGLATIRPDGTGLAYVADGTGAEHQPDWSATSCGA